MPHRERVSDSDRLGQVIAVVSDMDLHHNALEDKGGPKCNKHVVRIVGTAEMLLEAKYLHDQKKFLTDILTRIAEATALGKDPLNELERWMNRELECSIAPLIMH